MLRLAARTVAVLGLSVLTALAVIIGAREVFAATVVVSPSNMNGWAFGWWGFEEPPPGASGDFVLGPTGNPMGAGSARLWSLSGSTVNIHTESLDGTALSSLTELTFSTYSTQSVSPGCGVLYLYVETGEGLDLLTYNPSDQSAGCVLDVWQSWDGLTGKWQSNSFAFFPDGTTLQDYVSFLTLVGGMPPEIISIHDPSGWFDHPGVAFKASGWVPGDAVHIDKFAIGVNGQTTIYDFEPDVATTPTSTFTPTATFTATSTPTPTPTATATSTFTPTATNASVGGIAEQPDVAALPPGAPPSGRNYTIYILAAGGLAALGAGVRAWATRRRRKVG